MYEFNQDGLLILSTGTTDTMATGTAGTTITISDHQQSSLRDNQINEDMEIIQGTSILFGVVVGLVIALIANLLDQRLNRKEGEYIQYPTNDQDEVVGWRCGTMDEMEKENSKEG